jgi:flotillin
VAEPLSRIDRITLVSTGGEAVGVSKMTGEVAKVIAQVPPVVESLTGMNFAEMLGKLRPAGEAPPSVPAPPEPKPKK